MSNKSTHDWAKQQLECSSLDVVADASILRASATSFTLLVSFGPSVNVF